MRQWHAPSSTQGQLLVLLSCSVLHFSLLISLPNDQQVLNFTFGDLPLDAECEGRCCMSVAEYNFAHAAGQGNPAAASQELVSSTHQPTNAQPLAQRHSNACSLCCLICCCP